MIMRWTNTSESTGYREMGMEMNGEKIFVGGANANVLAALQLYKESHEAGRPIKIVFFGAGRPNYIASEPESFAESTVLSESFKKRLLLTALPMPRIVCGTDGKNTKGELLWNLRQALSENATRLAVITVLVHIPRVQEFYNLLLKEQPEFGSLETKFFSSEIILGKRYLTKPRYAEEICKFFASEAYERTCEKEMAGIEAIRAGKYSSAQDKPAGGGEKK